MNDREALRKEADELIKYSALPQGDKDFFLERLPHCGHLILTLLVDVFKEDAEKLPALVENFKEKLSSIGDSARIKVLVEKDITQITKDLNS